MAPSDAPQPPSPSPALEPAGFNGSAALNTTLDNPAYENNVSSLKAALVLNAIIGLGCLVGFLVFRSFMRQYQLRRHLPHVTIPPPAMQSSGVIARFFGWITPIFTTSDMWLMHSAGLDALVLQKSITLCLQIFLPIVVIGCALLMPLQLGEAFERGDSTFSRLTMANIAPRSNIMWAHWVFTLLFVGWTLLLLEWHFRQYVVLRQFYLRSSNGVNWWRKLHMAETDGVGVHDHSRFADLVDDVKTEGLLEAMAGEGAAPPDTTWWRKALTWLTSWTGSESPETVVEMDRQLTAQDAHGAVFSSLLSPSRGASGAGALSGGGGGDAGPMGEGKEGRTASPGSLSLDIPDDCGLTDDDDDDEPGEGGVVCAKRLADTAAPKWWTTVDTVRATDGSVRRLTAGEKAAAAGGSLLLAKPSVRYFKTINTQDSAGLPVAVQAQQYAVLVTNVDQVVYPEFTPDKKLGAGKCGAPKVKYGEEAPWMGQRHARLAKALEAARAAAAPPGSQAAKGPLEMVPPGSGGKGDIESLASGDDTAATEAPGEVVAGKDGSGGKSAALRKKALVSMAAGSMSRSISGSGARSHSLKEPPLSRTMTRAMSMAPPPSGRGAALWAGARAAMHDGRLRLLQRSDKYSLVAAVFAALFPYDFDRVVPVFNFREIDIKMRQWDRVRGQIENAQHALKLGGKRKTVKVKGHPAPLDKIAHLQTRAALLEAEVLEARERAMVRNSTPSFFVLFRTQKAAAVASSCNIHPLSREAFQVHPAPGPEEVNWQALWYTSRQRTLRALLVTPFLIFLVVLPVSLLTGAMTQINDAFCSPSNTKLRWEEYCRGDNPILEVAEGLLTGFVPALLIMLWQALAMPRLAYLAAQSEARHYSLSALDRRVGSIYFLWTVFNFFMGGVIGSTALAQLPEFVEKPMEIPNRLGYALPSSAKFFLTYLILRTFMTVPLRFLLPQPGVWQAWVRMGFGLVFKGCREGNATSRGQYMRDAIRSPRYGIEFGGNLCLVLLLSFAYATICPLVALFGLAFFAGNWVFWRYQLLYNYQRKYESGGLFFPFLADRIMVCAAIMVAFTSCVMIVKAAWAQATILALVGLCSIFYYYRRTRVLYINGLREMPLLVAAMAPRARVPASVYVPPPLQNGGTGWYPEFNKIWAHLGMPGYSW